MIFEFIIIHGPQNDDLILDILRERLGEALEANLNDVEEDALADMLRINFERPQPAGKGGKHRTMLGFSLELPEETASVREVVDDFADALMADPIAHALKCEDPLLRAELSQRAEELFALELKLRRVLSIIYLHAYPDGNPYELLAEESAQPMAKDKPQESQMKAAAENQFFHLTFGQYVGLNQRPQFKDLPALIRNQPSYDALREEISRKPVEQEDDAGFLAGLKERMDSIEKLRNAVAHNRRPSKSVTEDYLNALPLVNQALDEYLEKLCVEWPYMEERLMPWDQQAKSAAERVMETADWDHESGVVHLHDPDEPRMRKTASSEEELIQILAEAAETAFYAYCPRNDGEAIHDCEGSDIAADVLAAYQSEIEEVFGAQ